VASLANWKHEKPAAKRQVIAADIRLAAADMKGIQKVFHLNESLSMHRTRGL
jgi:hypothetical protein